MDDDTRRKEADYLGGLVALALGNDDSYVFEYKGKYYTNKQITELLFSDEECLGILLGYFIKYVETYKPSNEEIDQLIKAFGLSEFVDKLEVAINIFAAMHPGLALTLGVANKLNKFELLRFFYRMSDLSNPLLAVIREFVYGWLLENITGLNLTALSKYTSKTYDSIKVTDKDAAISTPVLASSKTYDYSMKCFEEYMNVVGKIEAVSASCTSGWGQYSGEDWYEKIFVSRAVSGINKYFSRLSDINTNCKTKITSIFNDAQTIDYKKSKQVHEATEILEKEKSSLTAIMGRVNA